MDDSYIQQIIFRAYTVPTIRGQDNKPILTYGDIGYTYLFRMVEAELDVIGLSIGGMNAGLLGDPENRWNKVAHVFGRPQKNPQKFINVVCPMSLEDVDTLIVGGMMNICIVAKEVEKPGFDFLMAKADRAGYDYIISPSDLPYVPELDHAQWHIVKPQKDAVAKWFNDWI